MTTEAMRTVRIEMGPRSYDIVIGPNAIAELGRRLAAMFPERRYAIVTDSNVARTQLTRVLSALDREGLWHATVAVPAGEASKSFSALEKVVDGLLAAKLERGDVVLALGGGVIGDLAGFAAAITRRGMALVQVPTSLLAQVDSSIGGKTGINSPRGKNLVGAFYQPKLVVADVSALDTLPEREFRAGYAEIVKHALINDAAFFDWLDANLDGVFKGGPARAEAIERSVGIKGRIVSADEREAGERALLNLGHTFGHALEAAAGYSDRLLHGEAVAIGCVLAHRFSAASELAPAADAERVEAHLRAAGLPTRLADIPGGPAKVSQLMEIMDQDKKVVKGKLTFILTRGIGRAFIAPDLPKPQIEKFLQAELQR